MIYKMPVSNVKNTPSFVGIHLPGLAKTLRYISLCLTHGGRVTYINISKLTIIGSNKGLSPGRRQAIIWTNVGILVMQTLRTTFSEIISEINAFSLKKCLWKYLRYGVNFSRLQWVNFQTCPIKTPVCEVPSSWMVSHSSTTYKDIKALTTSGGIMGQMVQVLPITTTERTKSSN